MTSSGGLQEYLAQFGRRFKLGLASRGMGFVALVALLLTIVLVFVANRYAFSDASVLSTRTLLFIGMAAAIAALVILPFRRLRRRGVAREVEENVPAFGGRVETYFDHARKAEQSGQKNPFLDLLAEDAMQVAETAPVESVLTTGRIASFAALAVLCVGTLLWLATAGPGYWGYGASRLWGGWISSADKPIYDVVVEPGDATVRSGATFEVDAELVGFDSNDVRIYAQYESGVEWEAAPMSPRTADSGFQFMFTGVREPFRYYVEAGGVRTNTYEVNVVVLPNIQTIKLNYKYPSWTGLEPYVEDPGGDVRAVVGTVVTVEATTDKPLAGGVLTVSGKDVPLRADGLVLRGDITVTEDGEYHFATIYDGEHVRLTDDFFITTVENQKPEVKISEPGRDWKATSIEEVPARFEVTDDFGVRSFELSYSVNGGEFTTVKLPAAGQKSVSAPHTFYLEDLRVAPSPFDRESAASEKNAAADGKRALRPGDLISYYVVAKDNQNTAQTDIYFIEVQPFDRQFSQSQQGGGGGGGQQQQRDEISRRQKEIISATWNLIREKESADSRSQEEIRESTVMLSELQRTLREQAMTMAERTRARQLDSTNGQFREFVENLEKAAAAMEPAADKLADLDLQAAVQPEQQALQFLLRAESIFTGIQVSMQQNGGGGGGGAGRDLAEMFELEMDLEKNQYETGGGASQQELEREVDDAFKKLEELAKRQQELADRMRNQQQTSFAERWQQEMLRREAEELKRQMEQLQRRQESAQNQQRQQGQQGQQGQSGQGGQQGQSGQQNAQQQRLQETIQRLEQATKSMQQGAQQSGQQQASSAQARQGAQQAQQQLQQALDQLAQQRQQANQSALRDLSNRADQLVQQQAQVQPHLEEALRNALEVMRQQQAEGRRNRLPSGLTQEQEREFSELKSKMAEQLRSMEADMQSASRSMRETQPGVSRTLREALSELQQEDIGSRLDTAAEYIRRQAAPYVANSEEGVARALRSLSDKLKEAQQLAEQGGGPGAQPGQERLSQALTEMENLRRKLEEAAGMNQGRDGQQQGQQGQQQAQNGQQQGQGQQPGEGQQGGQQQAQNGQQGQGQQPGQGQNPGQGQQLGQGMGGGQRGGGGSRFGGPATGGSDGSRLDQWGQQLRMPTTPEMRAAMEQALREGGRQIPQLTNELRRGGMSDEDLAELRRFAQSLSGERFRGNNELLEREYRQMITLLEQLELQARRQAELGQGGAVRAIVSQPVPEEYREAVAEYFRRLSEKPKQ